MYPVLGVVPRTVRIAIVEMSGDEIQRNAQPFRVSDQVPHVLPHLQHLSPERTSIKKSGMWTIKG